MSDAAAAASEPAPTPHWLDEIELNYQKMQQENQKESPQYITFYFYYCNPENVPMYIKKKRYTPHAAPAISAAEMIPIIQKYRMRDQIKYQLHDVFLYDSSTKQTKQIPLVLEDIQLSPAIFIYHDITAVFFLFKGGASTRLRIHSMTERAPPRSSSAPDPAPRPPSKQTRRARAHTQIP